MNRKKLMILAVVNALVFNFLGNSKLVNAEPINSSNTVEIQINDLNKQINSLENQMEITDNDIQNSMLEIKKNADTIDEINNNIYITNKKIKDREEMLRKDEINDKYIVKAMYESGGGSTILLNTIFESKNFSELVSKATAVNKVLSDSKAIIDKVYEDKEYIEKRQNTLISDKVKVQKLLKDNKDKLNALNKNKANQVSALSKLSSLKSYLNSNISNSANIYKQSVSLGHLIYGDDNVVNYAKNFLGVPYLWGGITPDGFDCSGFIQYVYAHFNISIPRTTYEQVNVGATVTDKLQPGDLIFFGDKSKPHHVGMYIGNGEYIQAPHTGDYIKISPIKGSEYSIAKRILPVGKK